MDEVTFPELRGDDPQEVLANFYTDIGWDGKKKIDGTKIHVNTTDWNTFFWRMSAVRTADSKRSSVGTFFLEHGPEPNDSIQRKTVLIEKGWMK